MDIFHNDHEVLQIGGLTIENQLGSVIITGAIEITGDDAGKQQAQALLEFAQALRDACDGLNVNEQVQAQAPKWIDNPFA